tara:strand:+ start:472 stop:1845 length:1374 start_codon:yes stop_codon:yes gene_type:complete
MPSTRHSDIRQIIDLFSGALKSLDYKISPNVIEKWSLLVHRAMDGGGRSYHGPYHILHLAQGSKPIVALSAIYHDIVQVSVDHGAPPEISKVFDQFVTIENGDYLLKEIDIEKDRITYFTSKIFGFDQGSKLNPYEGRNEFLSSLVCVHELDGYIKEKDLIKICVCIEATIPFRGIGSDGKDSLQTVRDRLSEINKKYSLGFSEDEIDQTLFRATELKNKDVDNFSEVLVENFIENTWNILPESSPAMRYPNTLRIKDFRKALQGMEGFLSSLKVERVYSSYKGYPSQSEMKLLFERAKINIGVALKYLRIRVYAIAILEAIADITGGDTSLSLFLGDMENQKGTVSLDDFLPLEDELKNKKDLDPLILRFLSMGHRGHLKYEMNSCLYTSVVYRVTGDERIQKDFSLVKDYFQSNLSAEDFLKIQDKYLMSSIIDSLLELVSTRNETLKELKKTLS